MTTETTDVHKAVADTVNKEERAERSTSPSTSPKPASDKKSEAARYAALRNHRIRLEDAIDPNAERVTDINKNDILFGRGKGFQNHPGNRRMREIVEKFKIKYHTLRRTEKQDLIESVYVELTEGGARFLKKLDKEDVWVNVDRPVALQKVSHTLRCRKGVLDKVMNENNKEGLAPTKMIGGGMSPSQQPPLPMSLTGLNAAFSPSAHRPNSPSLEAQQAVPTNTLSGLEAQRLAALERFRALTAMPFVNPPAAQAPTFLDQLQSNLRREQMIRQLMLQQQMQQQGQMASLQGRMGYMNQLGALAGTPAMMGKSILPTSPVNSIANQ